MEPARTWKKQRVPGDWAAVHTGDRDTSYSLAQPSMIVKEKLKYDWRRLRTQCYRRENQYWMYNWVSFITAYHDQFTILGALLHSSLSVLMDIMFLFVTNEEKHAGKRTFKIFSPACRWVRGWSGYTAVLRHTSLKASFEMFITVWVSVCKQLPVSLSSKIPWQAFSSEQK